MKATNITYTLKDAVEMDDYVKFVVLRMLAGQKVGHVLFKVKFVFTMEHMYGRYECAPSSHIAAQAA